MLKIEGDKPGGYREKLDQPTVHGCGVEPCCPAFPVPEPASTRPRMTTPEHISPESAKFLSSEQYVVSIDWSALIGHVYN